MGTINVKPWGQDQGDFVVIEEENFDPAFHVRLDDDGAEEKTVTGTGASQVATTTPETPVTAAMLRNALDARGIKYKPQASKAQLQALLDEATKQG